MELRNPSTVSPERSERRTSLESGMAHVSIFWALVPMVLMMAALFYAYDRHTSLIVAQEERQAAIKSQAELRDQRDARTELLSKLTTRIGNVGNFTYENLESGEKVTLTEFATPDQLDNKFQTVGLLHKDVMPTSTTDTMDELLASLKTALDTQKEQVARLQTDLNAALEQKTATENRLNETITEKDREIDRLSSQVVAEGRKVERTVENYVGQVESAREQTRRAQDERRRTEEESQAKIKGMQKEIDLRDARLHAAQDQLRIIKSEDSPDGQILAASDQTGLAWIDLGARDLVKNGLTFRVLEKTKDGYNFKGNAIVTRVEDDRSEVRIENLVDRYNPVVRGDVITNDLFSPKLKRNVMLIGRFVTPLTKDEIKARLESMGNTVFETFSPSVDLVIVGREELGEEATKIQDMPDFQMAQKLSVEIVPLQRVRDFLRL